ASPELHTYHCLCTHLLLATTTQLPALPRRGTGSALDKAFILPLPPTPIPDGDDDAAGNYALLVGTAPERKAEIVRREDGYEKRYVQRCGRCRLVVGYQLDWSQYADAKGEDGTVRSGKREDVVYLLPGGLLDTDEMMAG
ncbi:hypothetical protein K490DRAFT_15051, partial [Saccharata proteae CBS 121410]